MLLIRLAGITQSDMLSDLNDYYSILRISIILNTCKIDYNYFINNDHSDITYNLNNIELNTALIKITHRASMIVVGYGDDENENESEGEVLQKWQIQVKVHEMKIAQILFRFNKVPFKKDVHILRGGGG